MLNQILVLRNIGKFHSCTPGAAAPLAPFSVLFAENGRGKTTLAAILRSLSTGEAEHILDRHRLGADRPPEVRFQYADNSAAQFTAGAWNNSNSDILIFDDEFVERNISSGLQVGSGQKQQLHEFVIGEQGVQLNNGLLAEIAAVEEHNRRLRGLERAVPNPPGIEVNQFCGLEATDDAEAQIAALEKELEAVQASAEISAQVGFREISPTTISVGDINAILGRSLGELTAAAEARVKDHLRYLGEDSEGWIRHGMHLAEEKSDTDDGKPCPFCAQDLDQSEIYQLFQTYFSEEYESLLSDVERVSREFEEQHGESATVSLRSDYTNLQQNVDFWKRFIQLPNVDIDPEPLLSAWREARIKVQASLAAKRAAPLTKSALPPKAIEAISAYAALSEQSKANVKALTDLNPSVESVKANAAGGNALEIRSAMDELAARAQRSTDEAVEACNAYLAEKQAKARTEARRDDARAALERYRVEIFPAYEEAINRYLARFGASFRLGRFEPRNTRAGSSATFSVLIENHEVNLTATQGPSFRNTLSGGDRNTLALAFFFASLDHANDRANKIVVFDDPMTSLDENRRQVTIDEIVNMRPIVSQILILSHSKAFLLQTWDAVRNGQKSALRLQRAQNGSEIEPWNPSQDALTTHDRRFLRVAQFVEGAGNLDDRQVASDLRPMLETFCRIAFAGNFGPGSLLGELINRADQRIGTDREIMSEVDLAELRSLTNYSNRFHHDTNPNYQVEQINDEELRGFADRVLRFMRRA